MTTSVIVMPPSAGPFVLLYSEEREAIRERIVQRLAALDPPSWRPWPDEKMRVLADRVAAGKLRENGPICARPPTLAEVVDAETNGGNDQNLAVAMPSLDCDGHEECMMQVSVGGLEGEREADLMLSSKVTATDDHDGPGAWLAAADALAPVDELVGNGYLTATGAPPPLVRASVGHSVGDFGATFEASPSLPPASALAACHEPSPTRREQLSYTTLVTVDPKGHAAKCAVLHNEPTHDPAQLKREACICQAAEKTKFPELAPAAKPPKNTSDTATASESRRVLFDIYDSPLPKKHPRKVPVEARVNLLEGAGHPEASETLDIPQLSDCYLETNPKEDVTFDVKLHLAANGKVESVDIATVPNQMRACLTRAYLATPFVCDMNGEARVLHAGVTLSQRRANVVLEHPPTDEDRAAPPGHK